MAYRARRLDWNNLIAPTSRGIDTEARASENLSRMIFGGLESVGRGIVRDRTEKRRDRIANKELGIRQGYLDLAESKEETSRMEAQAYKDSLLSQADELSTGINQAGATGQPPNPQAVDALRTTVADLGGPGQAQAAMETKDAPRPPDLSSTDLLMQGNDLAAQRARLVSEMNPRIALKREMDRAGIKKTSPQYKRNIAEIRAGENAIIALERDIGGAKIRASAQKDRERKAAFEARKAEIEEETRIARANAIDGMIEWMEPAGYDPEDIAVAMAHYEKTGDIQTTTAIASQTFRQRQAAEQTAQEEAQAAADADVANSKARVKAEDRARRIAKGEGDEIEKAEKEAASRMESLQTDFQKRMDKLLNPKLGKDEVAEPLTAQQVKDEAIESYRVHLARNPGMSDDEKKKLIAEIERMATVYIERGQAGAR